MATTSSTPVPCSSFAAKHVLPRTDIIRCIPVARESSTIGTYVSMRTYFSALKATFTMVVSPLRIRTPHRPDKKEVHHRPVTQKDEGIGNPARYRERGNAGNAVADVAPPTD